MTKPNSQDSLPKINEPLMRGFSAFCRWYLQKHFHTVAVNRTAVRPLPLAETDCFVGYANHASWWDPLTALFVAEQVFPGFSVYAPIDKEAFEKYRFFGQMGFYPVDQKHMRGAGEFLRISRNILQHPSSSIWMTPEGRFVDVRDRSAPFMPGLSHLAASLQRDTSGKEAPNVWFIPAAIEYTFWEERLPELLVWVGEPLSVRSWESNLESQAGSGLNRKQELNELLKERLRDAQQKLAAAAQRRDPTSFEVLLKSSGKTFFLYDWGRRLRSWMRGKRFDAGHSDKFS